MWSSTCFLISIASTADNSGDCTPEVTIKREIFCKELSIGQSEFYQAQATRFNPQIKLKIYRMEYGGETQVEYMGKIYDVIRTYATGEDLLELTLGGMVDGTSQ